jgi:hypothetical protein
MNDLVFSSAILDWLAVFGYVGLTVFIMWRIFTSK